VGAKELPVPISDYDLRLRDLESDGACADRKLP